MKVKRSNRISIMGLWTDEERKVKSRTVTLTYLLRGIIEREKLTPLDYFSNHQTPNLLFL